MNLRFSLEILFTLYIRHKTVSQELTKNIKSRTLDIIGLYLFTGSAAYKVIPVKSFHFYNLRQLTVFH